MQRKKNKKNMVKSKAVFWSLMFAITLVFWIYFILNILKLLLFLTKISIEDFNVKLAFFSSWFFIFSLYLALKYIPDRITFFYILAKESFNKLEVKNETTNKRQIRK
jgi:hypothetical protein